MTEMLPGKITQQVENYDEFHLPDRRRKETRNLWISFLPSSRGRFIQAIQVIVPLLAQLTPSYKREIPFASLFLSLLLEKKIR